jgi:CheY-like chemotaxis protein
MKNIGSILLADDEESVLRATSTLLRKAGYECGCAKDADTAAQMLRERE